MTGQQLRAMMISEFCQWLRSRTNKEKRPFQEETITAYKVAARALDAWMTSAGLDGDFTACDAGTLNKFFRDYRAAHGQGGTNTKQRNLRHLFTWLEHQYEHPHPYTDDLNRLLCEGLRRTEIVQMSLDDLPADLVLQPLVRVVPLKGARAEDAGRLVPLASATARAISSYLRMRRYHRHAASPQLWLGLRNHRADERLGAVPDAPAPRRTGGVCPGRAPAHVPAHVRQRLAVQWRVRGGPDAADRVEEPGDARPVRRGHGAAAGNRD